jgi:hypothetical protein
MDLDSKIGGFWRSPRLYVKALVLKEVFKASLRYAGELSIIGVRIPKSTLHYWEMKHEDIVGGFKNTLQTQALYSYRGVGEGVFGALTVLGIE